MLHIVREALSYISHFRGKIFVIKLGEEVAERAEEFGVIADVYQLHEVGIKVVLMHTKPNLNLNHWPSLFGKAVHCFVDIHSSICSRLKDGMIPVVYCGESKDPANRSGGYSGHATGKTAPASSEAVGPGANRE